MFRKRLPELAHIITSQNETVYVTLDSVVGLAYKIDVIDIEGPSPEHKILQVIEFIRALPPYVTVRLHLKVSGKNELEFDNFRRATFYDKGFVSETIFCFIETFSRAVAREKPAKNPDSVPVKLKGLLKDLPTHFLENLGATPMTEPEVRGVFEYGSSEILNHTEYLETSTEKWGVIRLSGQNSSPLDEATLACIKQALPLPYEICVSIVKQGKVETHSKLKRNSASPQGSDHPIMEVQALENKENLVETFLGGVEHVEFEWLLILKRKSEEGLSDAINQAKRDLPYIGKFNEELGGGRLNSYLASCPGSRQHVTLTESDHTVWAYLPIFSFGKAEPKKAISKRSLLLHRLNDSIFDFDGFNRDYGGCNIIINGMRGSGKSFLAYMLTKAFLEDSQLKMIEFDVGGSGKKLCERTGGYQVNFEPGMASGFNNFRILKQMPESKEVVSALVAYLAPLMLETGEKQLSRSMEIALESALLCYGSKGTQKPSLSDFLKQISGVPRSDLLERWTKGIFENAFKETSFSSELFNSKHLYFNFKNLTDASNKDYLKGVFGAFIAFTNIEMLKAGDAFSAGTKTRIILKADECPFLVEQFASQLDFCTANFRKYRHGTLLIAQSLKSFEYLDPTGRINRNIIKNSPIRFFSQREGSNEEFKRDYDLTDIQVNAVNQLERGQNFREFLLQTPSESYGTESRTVRVKSTRAEYWEATSDRDDNEKLHALRQAVPKLTLEEAIACLSMAGA